jgi:hypothetical protein
MQVLLKRSDENQDVECAVCRQGFRLFWERLAPAERVTMRAIVEGELRRHHDSSDTTADAHPAGHFSLPEWAAEPELATAGYASPAAAPAYARRLSPTPRHSR